MSRAVEQIRLNGVRVDQAAPDVAGEWTDARNAISRDGYMERIQGVADILGAPIGDPVYLLPALTPTAAYWMYATATDQVGVADGTGHFDISPIPAADTGGRQNAWTGGIFNGVPFLNPGVSDPLFWDLQTGSPCASLPGWTAPANCGAMRAHLNYLFALDYTDELSNEFPQMVRWSDAAEPGTLPTTWAPAAGNDAGSLSLAATPGPVIDGLSLRNTFIAYKRGSCYALDFIGGNFIFGQRLLFRNVGVLSRNCVAEFEGRHAVLTDGDFIVHDGHRAESVIDARLRRFIFDNINPDNFERAFVVANKPASEIWICYPSGASVEPDIAVVWSWEDNQFGIRELYETPNGATGVVPTPAAASQSWDSQLDTWNTIARTWGQTNFNPAEDALVLADLDDGFYQVDTGIDVAGTPIGALLTRESLDFGDPQAVKTVRSVWPKFDGNALGDELSVRVGAQMERNDPISWSAPQTFTLGTDNKVDVFATGRYLSFEFTSQGGNLWRARGFDVEFATVSNY